MLDGHIQNGGDDWPYGHAVNARTYLATDYLNHFNEAIMLLDLVPSMPDVLDDLKEWRPKSYVAHFEDASFKDAVLCIAAFEHVPPCIRTHFDETIAKLNRSLINARDALVATADSGQFDRLGDLAEQSSVELLALIDIASGIINGADLEERRDDASRTETDHIDATQATVDALFD